MRKTLLLLCVLFVLASCQSEAELQEQLKQEAQQQAQQQVDQAVEAAKEEANKAKDSFVDKVGQTVGSWTKPVRDWWSGVTDWWNGMWGKNPPTGPGAGSQPGSGTEPGSETEPKQDSSSIYIINTNGALGRPCANRSTKCNYVKKFNRGDEITVTGTESGEAVNGNSVWLIVSYENSTIYVHSSVADPKPSSAEPQPQSPSGDEFTYPVDLSKKDWDNAYNGHTPIDRNQPCYQLPYRQLWHAGYDIGFNSFKGEDGQWTNNTPVYAVAEGVVRYSSKPTGKTDKDGKPIYGGTTGYPGGVVIIEHIRADNTPLYAEYGTAVHSMYAHLDPDKIQVSAGQRVTKGTLLATGLKQQVSTDPKTGAVTLDNTHLHWEMRYFYDGSEIKKSPEYKDACATQPGPGYAYDKDDSMAHPDNFQGIIGKNQDGSLIRKTYHWTNPPAFVDNH